MVHTITIRCTQCGDCVPQCPVDAIKKENGHLWIDPTLCNDCQGHAPEPQCVSSCSIDDSPMPLQAKKGRCKTSATPVISSTLFLNSKSSPFASAIVVWEACNILAQRYSLNWYANDQGHFCYQRQVNAGRSTLTFYLTQPQDIGLNTPLEVQAGEAELATWDVRAACLHLIFAAHAMALDEPWQEEFIISDRQIEDYLGLEKRKDLSKLTKLTLIKELVQTPCKLMLDLNALPQGRVPGITLEKTRLWHLLEVKHYFQTDELGCNHLVGLTFRIKAGLWAKHFLNQKGAKECTAFYQYSSLPKSLLLKITSIWQQHDGAARMLLWLLFKTKMGHEQRLTIPTLMRIAYGEARVNQAVSQREERKRLLRSFESDLEVLHQYGLKPQFDPVTYPTEIQPLWVKLAALPDDPEAALEFWTNDGSNGSSLIDAAPRDKWHRLMQARFLCFELPAGWEVQANKSTSKKSRKSLRKDRARPNSTLSVEQIIDARKNLQLSQRALANYLGKSQSWVRDIEKGRLQLGLKDQQLLQKVLGFGT
jgi:DNA-binding transcriptional regulator YiaG/NAD-dependent dihydropyrimidine dehydrogenase PreA subunit